MEFVQAQFSLKYEPQVKIRRSLNDIEDCLQGHYGIPQSMPIPDDFAADAPRIIINSLNGHSQINFSQISVDFTVNFDGDYRNDFDLTKNYILERLALLKNLLHKIGISKYYFCGLSYNIHLDTKDKSSIEYVSDKLGIETDKSIYEASRRIAYVVEDKFFVNQQIGTYKEYQSKGISIPNLMDFSNSTLVDEGVSLSLDVNNRYQYLITAEAVHMEGFDDIIEKVYMLIGESLKKWG